MSLCNISGDRLVTTEPGKLYQEWVMAVVDNFPADPAWPLRFERGKSYAFKIQLIGFHVYFQAEYHGDKFQTDQSSVTVGIDCGVALQ